MLPRGCEYLLLDPCAYCGGAATQIDHIVPADVGGTDDWDNLTATCGPCNSRKQTRGLLDFLAFRGAMADAGPILVGLLRFADGPVGSRSVTFGGLTVREQPYFRPVNP